MAGTLPVNDFVRVTMTSNQPGQTSVSISGRRQTKQYATQFWTFDCEYRSLQREDAAKVMAFISKQRNNLLDFDVEMPVFSNTQGTVTTMIESEGVSATLNIASNTAAGISTIPVSSQWTSSSFANAGVSANTALKAGDFITFSNHYKTYQITDDVAFDSAGNANISIYPGLISSVTTSHSIDYNNVLFHVFLQDNNQAYEFGTADRSSISLRLQESF